MKAATSVTASAPRAATSRCRRRTRCRTCARRCSAAMAKMGVKVEKHHHEVASAQHELGMKFDTLTLMADHMQIYKYCIHQVAHIYGKTATFMPKPIYRRQRLGHARAPVDLEGRQAGVRRQQIRRPVGDLPALHRRHHQARQGDQRLHQPVDQLLQASGPGYEAPVLLAYSARNRSASCRIPYTDLAEGQARGGPLPRSDGQSVSRLRGDADGRSRRHQEQDRSGSGDGQGPLRSAARRAEADPDGVRFAPRGAGKPRQGPRLPEGRRRVRRRLHRRLHRVEDGRRDALRNDAAPGRIRHVLFADRPASYKRQRRSRRSAFV
ncbi:hypothetical protein BVRB_019730, partial [Beta vulgaris subsp. vulgaris]